jgi:hypothetical protein
MVISIKRLFCLLFYAGIGLLYAETPVTHITPKIFDYNELVNNAYPLDDIHMLYSVCKKDRYTTLTPVGRAPELLGGYFFYKIWDIQDTTTSNDRCYVRTSENIDIQIENGPIKCVFDNQVFIGSQYTPAVWEIGKNTAAAKPYDLTAFSGYDSIGIINSMFYEDNGGVFPEVDYFRRVRGNVVLFTGSHPEPGYRYRIYRFNRDAVEMLAHSDNPLELHVPELKGYKEAFEIDSILYLQDIEHGTYTILGRTKERADDFIYQGLEAHLWFYESNSKEYWYDFEHNISILDEAVKNTDPSNIDISEYN